MISAAHGALLLRRIAVCLCIADPFGRRLTVTVSVAVCRVTIFLIVVVGCQTPSFDVDIVVIFQVMLRLLLLPPSTPLLLQFDVAVHGTAAEVDSRQVVADRAEMCERPIRFTDAITATGQEGQAVLGH